MHVVDLTKDDVVVSETVPVLAVWVPRHMDLDWIVQDQSIVNRR